MNEELQCNPSCVYLTGMTTGMICLKHHREAISAITRERDEFKDEVAHRRDRCKENEALKVKVAGLVKALEDIAAPWDGEEIAVYALRANLTAHKAISLARADA